jgi:hypothetical protein
MKWNNRKAARIQLEHKHRVDLMVSMEGGDEFAPLPDDSESAAKLEVGTLPAHSRLVLSSTGMAFRRCIPFQSVRCPEPVLIRLALD